MATVLITGAAKRVGRTIALDLARAGWDVALHYHTSEDAAKDTANEIEAIGRKAILVQGDLVDIANVPAIIEKAGRVECLIHNASLFEKDDVATMTPESWQAHIDVNLTAPMFLNQAFLAQEWLQELEYDASKDVKAAANIICLSDGMHDWSITPNFMSYSVSRLAMEQALKLLAKSVAPHVRVNGLALGATIEGHMDKPDTFQKIRERADLKRVSNVDEVCDTVHYLLSANSVTGQVIHLSGNTQSN